MFHAWEKEHILHLTDAPSPSSHHCPLIFDSIELIYSSLSNRIRNVFSPDKSDECTEFLSIFSRFAQGCISLSWMVKAYMDRTVQNFPLQNNVLILRKMWSSYKYICHGHRFSNIDPFNFDVTQSRQGLNCFGVSGSSYDDFFIYRRALKTRFSNDSIQLLKLKQLEMIFQNFMRGVHDFIKEHIENHNRRVRNNSSLHLGHDEIEMSFNIHSNQDEMETLPLYFVDNDWIRFFQQVLVDENPIGVEGIEFIDEIKTKRIDWPDTRSGVVYPTNVQNQSDDEGEDIGDGVGMNILHQGDDINLEDAEDEDGIDIAQVGDDMSLQDVEDEDNIDEVQFRGNANNQLSVNVVSDEEN